MVGEGTEVGNDTMIKHSIVGNHCKIGQRVSYGGKYTARMLYDLKKLILLIFFSCRQPQCRIVNTIIMDHVILEDGVQLSVSSQNA